MAGERSSTKWYDSPFFNALTRIAATLTVLSVLLSLGAWAVGHAASWEINFGLLAALAVICLAVGVFGAWLGYRGRGRLVAGEIAGACESARRSAGFEKTSEFMDGLQNSCRSIEQEIVVNLHRFWFPSPDNPAAPDPDYRVSFYATPENCSWECHARSGDEGKGDPWPVPESKHLSTAGMVVNSAHQRVGFQACGIPDHTSVSEDDKARYLRKSFCDPATQEKRSWPFATIATYFLMGRSESLGVLVIERRSGKPIERSTERSPNQPIHTDAPTAQAAQPSDREAFQSKDVSAQFDFEVELVRKVWENLELIWKDNSSTDTSSTSEP